MKQTKPKKPQSPEEDFSKKVRNVDEHYRNKLRVRDSVDTVPTYTPKTFSDQFVFYDDGTSTKLYVYINGSWVGFDYQSGFVARNDGPVWDYNIADLTLDGSWHTLDYSSILPDGASAVYLKVVALLDSGTPTVKFRRDSSHYQFFYNLFHSDYMNERFIIPVNSNKTFEYNIDSSVSAVDMVVTGWWK